MDRIVIVGGGAAAVAAAETLRRTGHAGSLTLVCGEPELPYDRPPLSKQVLTGAWENERIRLREASHYADLGIRLIQGRAAPPPGRWPRPVSRSATASSATSTAGPPRASTRRATSPPGSTRATGGGCGSSTG